MLMLNTRIKLLTILASAALLSACASKPMPIRSADFSPVLPAEPIVKTVADGSIYSGGANDSLFGDRKAYRVGDIITIMLREKTMAEKSASNVTSRAASNSMAMTGVTGGLLGENLPAGATIDNIFFLFNCTLFI